MGDAAQTITDLDRKDIELVALAVRFDMTHPYGPAMAQMASVFAGLERAMIPRHGGCQWRSRDAAVRQDSRPHSGAGVDSMYTANEASQCSPA